MSERKILVTGATGATGGKTVKLLLERGQSVRALVHSDDDRARALRAAGAEVVLGDLRDFASVRAALEGTRAAYFVFPIEPGILEATAYFAQAAQETGAEVVVNLSQITARREARSHAAQNHWIAERVFDWSGIPVIHLRPTLFSEWVLYWAGFIKAAGLLPLPFKTGHHAPIAAEDQARVIANLLVSPAGHIGKTYPLFGTTEITFPEMAEAIGRVVGKPVRYQYTPAPVLGKLAKEQGKNLSDFFLQHLAEIALDYENNIMAGTNNLVEELGGKPPIGLDDFIAQHRAELTS